MKNNHLNLHDKFLRRMMTKPKIIEEFFAENLPANIKSAVDLTSIKFQPESFVDEKWKRHVTDLLYSVQFNEQQGYIYLLVEHQSTPDRMMPFRILSYIVSVMEYHLQHSRELGVKTLPIVYPMVIYAGKRKYNYSTDIFDLFEGNKDLAREILLQPFKLIDLMITPDQELERYIWYGMLARTMKHIFDEDINPFLETVIDKFKIIENHGDEDYICTVFSYIIKTGAVKNTNRFREIIKLGLTDKNEVKIMNIAEQFRQEGMQKGIQEGSQATLKMIALNLLREGESVEKIVKITGLSKEKIEKLKKKKGSSTIL